MTDHSAQCLKIERIIEIDCRNVDLSSPYAMNIKEIREIKERDNSQHDVQHCFDPCMRNHFIPCSLLIITLKLDRYRPTNRYNLIFIRSMKRYRCYTRASIRIILVTFDELK